MSIPREIIRRDGSREPFDAQRIARAIALAGDATGQYGREAAGELAKNAVDRIAARCTKRLPAVEEVQDIVERVLVDAGHLATARAYIVYREQHKQLREDGRTLIDVEDSMEEYLEQ